VDNDSSESAQAKTQSVMSNVSGLKGSKGMAKEPPPKQTWIQPYLPGLDSDQPVELIVPEDQDGQGI